LGGLNMTIAYINVVSKFNNASGTPYINIKYNKYFEPPDCRLSRSNFCVFCGPARNAYMIPELLASMRDFQTGDFSKIAISADAYNAYEDITAMFDVVIEEYPTKFYIGLPCEEIPIVDPCEEIVCENICIGTDLYSQKCVNGECVTDQLLEANSLSCGYIPPCPIPIANFTLA